ncbi:NAD(P)H-binding [Paraburkholderia fungorum]|uniref:NAD(P)H-binding n=1 Tax=Paraburkholderia fungorum TaxID=134537 RepID=A0A1H1JYG7_9BURK|nr:NAD(P)H-binding protein [Paraburkholderia fungorum]SDR54810.1 NAD(P)H-binding [Paraburkholderia fungorum]
MNVLLIGATGGTGGEILSRLLAAGHTVTAVVRRPEAIAIKHESLVLITGSVLAPDLMARAMRGQTAVISAFGPRSLKKDDAQEVLMRNILAAMAMHGVKRLVNLSAWGAQDSHKHINLMQTILQGTLLRDVFADKKRAERLLFSSDVDYVNACPGRLLNKPARGGVKASTDGTGIKQSMTRADLAEWMVGQLASDIWLRQSPVVG